MHCQELAIAMLPSSVVVQWPASSSFRSLVYSHRTGPNPSKYVSQVRNIFAIFSRVGPVLLWDMNSNVYTTRLQEVRYYPTDNSNALQPTHLTAVPKGHLLSHDSSHELMAYMILQNMLSLGVGCPIESITLPPTSYGARWAIGTKQPASVFYCLWNSIPPSSSTASLSSTFTPPFPSTNASSCSPTEDQVGAATLPSGLRNVALANQSESEINMLVFP
jgi:hypothetical protein